ncbi:unnamed protein product [Protopolystoma xenopodis]|uniref:Uncharacterized protein n=1 Tax=Protopolystoma xenopodis TaxID=117903 RepID=A0A3S5AG08_9PLAT|nr:unnamed protein product [Protopolystoma xenopodis]
MRKVEADVYLRHLSKDVYVFAVEADDESEAMEPSEPKFREWELVGFSEDCGVIYERFGRAEVWGMDVCAVVEKGLRERVKEEVE